MMSSKNNIKGKRIRNQVFSNTLLIIVALILLIVLCTAMQLPSDFILVIQIFAPMALILLFAILISFRKVLCILSDDRLYYFLHKNYGMEFTVVSGNRRKVLSRDGWVLYSDIRKYEHLPPTRHLPSRVILYGSDFELQINGVGKRFIEQLRQRQESCLFIRATGTGSRNAPSLQTARTGLWKEIWEFCDTNTLEDVLHVNTPVHVVSDERLDTIDFEVKTAEHAFVFSMDDCSIYMCSVNNDSDQTIYYEHIADIEALFSLMRDFIDHNS